MLLHGCCACVARALQLRCMVVARSLQCCCTCVAHLMLFCCKTCSRRSRCSSKNIKCIGRNTVFAYISIGFDPARKCNTDIQLQQHCNTSATKVQQNATTLQHNRCSFVAFLLQFCWKFTESAIQHFALLLHVCWKFTESATHHVACFAVLLKLQRKCNISCCKYIGMLSLHLPTLARSPQVCWVP